MWESPYISNALVFKISWIGKKSCDDVVCDPNADCMERNPQRGPECICRQGFVGNGVVCEPGEKDDCSVINYCDSRAECVYNEQKRRNDCRCRPGFTGRTMIYAFIYLLVC